MTIFISGTDGRKPPATFTFGPLSFTLTDKGYESDTVGTLTTISILHFTYNGKPRRGIDLGNDSRPDTNNRMVFTLDGLRSFKKDRIEDLKLVGRIVSGAINLDESDTNIEELI